MDTNLSSKEVFIMRYIVNKSKSNNYTCIINNNEILDNSPEKFKFTDNTIYQTLTRLENDFYFELTKCSRRGESVYIVKLTPLGKAFERSQEQKRRDINRRFVWNIVFAALGAIVTMIVRSLFE